MARAGLKFPSGLEEGALELDGRHRTYAFAPAAQPRAPLLIVLHGAGGTGLGMAALTGLAERGPAAGFATVFPDGYGGVWNDNRAAPRLASRERIDDVAFLNALVERLTVTGVAAPEATFVTGISNGAFLAEHLARHALLPLAGVALIAGTATVVSRQAIPTPVQATLVLAFQGTADPLVPYTGGPIGPLGRLIRRRASQQPLPAGRGLAAPAEAVAADWARANGCPHDPTVEQLPVPAGDLPVSTFTWHAPGRPSVVLYRIEGGGHTWPGAAQYLPTSVIGPVARNLDATGILLDVFKSVTGD